MKNNSNQSFLTSDLGLTAALLSHGCQIEKMDRTNPGKIKFVVRGNDDLNRLIQGYWSKDLRVDALSYFESLKNIKSRIYQ